jgi:hypothetical protein
MVATAARWDNQADQDRTPQSPASADREFEGQLRERPVTLTVEPRLERIEVPALWDDQVARLAQLITELTAVGRQEGTMLSPCANPVRHP